MAPFDGRWLFEDHVGIRATEPKRTHGRASDIAVGNRPLFQSRIDIKRTIGKPDGWIAGDKMQGGRYLFVFKGKEDLQHTCNACGCRRVAEIGLDRTDGTELFSLSILTEGVRYGFEFNRVAQFGARPMRFDHLNSGRVNR